MCIFKEEEESQCGKEECILIIPLVCVNIQYM